MGNSFSKSISNRVSHISNQAEGIIPRGVKRKREDEHEGETSTTFDEKSELNTPKRRRIQSTSKYIYQTLFLNGENSDVTILALGKNWNLHKLYLSQSPYFASMFGGSWKETDMSTIELNITDENIDETAFRIALGSLYKDDVFLKPVQVIGVVAVATLLQLDGLIEQCTALMVDTLSASTVCAYNSAAQVYGLGQFRQECLDWLKRNLMLSQDSNLLKDISMDLMKQLISSPDLCVYLVEMDIYTLLKKWIFLHHTPSWSGSIKDLQTDTQEFFKEKLKESENCYLELEEGKPFIPVFECIRWQSVINCAASIRTLESDRILPTGWLQGMYEYSWKRLLQVEQGLDKGPQELEEGVFEEQCTRCGRVLQKEGEYCWRWVGYSYGVDLLISLNNRLLSLKRNSDPRSCLQSLSGQPKRYIYYRLTIYSFDGNGRSKFSKSVGLKKIHLGPNEEEVMLLLEKDVQFPLHISFNVMVASPVANYCLPLLKVPCPPNVSTKGSQTEPIRICNISATQNITRSRTKDFNETSLVLDEEPEHL
ncbi:hypothetical protein CHS0354_039550 [Potamilus streckersoni]|uniref:BTB domain-containing protein n=1 Tax=Potamilus streckersoni TaxID=2493646 RepID=A0AAE0WFW2_9BIVA|nr:hypothetical protein CHS0354_039550 [Potamilus streckersoni]